MDPTSTPTGDGSETPNSQPPVADNGTGAEANDPNPSKSADTPAADDDKSTPTPDASQGDGGESSGKQDDTPASQFDDDLDDWVDKRGLPKPTTDDERKAYQTQRDEQRDFHAARQAKEGADDLSQAVNDAKDDLKDPEGDDEGDDDRITALEKAHQEERTLRLQNEFYTTNKVTNEQHKVILDIMKEKFNTPASREGKQRALDMWSSVDALPDLLDLAKARLAVAEQGVVIDEAARQERERIERESNANSPGRHASQVTTNDKTEDDARLERFKARYNKS